MNVHTPPTVGKPKHFDNFCFFRNASPKTACRTLAPRIQNRTGTRKPARVFAQTGFDFTVNGSVKKTLFCSYVAVALEEKGETTGTYMRSCGRLVLEY